MGRHLLASSRGGSTDQDLCAPPSPAPAPAADAGNSVTVRETWWYRWWWQWGWGCWWWWGSEGFFSVPFPNVQNLTSAFCEILPKNLLKDSPCRSCKVFGKLKNSNANPQILLRNNITKVHVRHCNCIRIFKTDWTSDYTFGLFIGCIFGCYIFCAYLLGYFLAILV